MQKHLRAVASAYGFPALYTLTMVLFSGCAFDLSRVKQTPATFEATAVSGTAWTLKKEVKIHIGTGYSTLLKKDTHWEQVGRIEQGTVFRTKDQIVKVEASNIYEAYIVLNGKTIVGFYLPVEHSFTPATPPVDVEPGLC